MKTLFGKIPHHLNQEIWKMMYTVFDVLRYSRKKMNFEIYVWDKLNLSEKINSKF